MLEIIGKRQASEQETYAHATSSQPRPSTSGIKHRRHTAQPEPPQKREYTADQEKIVKRIVACRATDYYAILNVKKDCEEGDVKKAYKKVCAFVQCLLLLIIALSSHFNCTQTRMERRAQMKRLNVRAYSQAFAGSETKYQSVVSKAFQILSDPQKKAIYDSNPGAYPDSRASGFPAASTFRGGRHATFDGEMSPEDLFNMFFGGGGFGDGAGFSQFGGAPGTTIAVSTS